MKQQKNNVFSGSDAVSGFLDLDNATPLVELPESLNPFWADDVRIFAKIFNNPNIKLLPAINMMEEAKQSGKLDGVHTIVEATSGNMGYAIRLVMDRYRIKNMVPVIPWDISAGKQEILRLLRMQPHYHDGNGIELARELGKRRGWLNLDQYSNPANPAAHEKWTGPQIYEQMEKDITIFVAGLGTTATMEGVSRFLKGKLGNEITTVGVLIKEESDPESKPQGIPGVRSEAGLKDIGFNWKKWSDDIQKVSARFAYLDSHRMMRCGIPAGPSSGFALRGLTDFLRKKKAAGTLDAYRNDKGMVRAVFICPDPPEKYLEKYSTIMDLADFKD